MAIPLFFIPCKVLPGLLDSELYVMLEASSAYVPRAAVRVHGELSDSAVDGAVEVMVIERDAAGGRVLIELPGAAVVGHARSWAPVRLLTSATA